MPSEQQVVTGAVKRREVHNASCSNQAQSTTVQPSLSSQPLYPIPALLVVSPLNPQGSSLLGWRPWLLGWMPFCPTFIHVEPWNLAYSPHSLYALNSQTELTRIKLPRLVPFSLGQLRKGKQLPCKHQISSNIIKCLKGHVVQRKNPRCNAKGPYCGEPILRYPKAHIGTARAARGENQSRGR